MQGPGEARRTLPRSGAAAGGLGVRAIASGLWVSFDLDGTLFDNRLRRFMVHGLEGAFLPRRRRRLRRRTERPPGRLRRLRSRAAAPWLRAIRHVTVRSVAPRTVVYPDVVPVLGRLRERGYGIAAVTNGYLAYQGPLLEGIGLRALIDHIVAPEVVRAAKPDPRVWTEGMAGRRVILHVGDRLEDDVAGAHAAGIAAAFLRRTARPMSRRLRRRVAEVRPEVMACDLWQVLEALERPGGTESLVRAAEARQGP